MSIVTKKSALVLLAAISISLAMPVRKVEAQSLIKLLFGKQSQQSRDYRRQPQSTASKAVVKVKKVKTARFFNYRAKPMQKIKIAAIAGALASTTSQAESNAANPSLFVEALRKTSAIDSTARADIIKAVTAHYRANPQFMWVSNYGPNQDANALLGVLNSADEYGLDAADYNVELPAFSTGESVSDEEYAALINFEFAMTLRAVRYALDANGGRVNPNKLSGYHDFPGKKLNAKQVVAKLFAAVNRPGKFTTAPAETEALLQTASVGSDQIPAPSTTKTNADNNGPSSYLLSLQPSHPSFETFRQELATLRQSVDSAIVIAPDTLLKPGKSHVELPNIVKAIENKSSEKLRTEFADTFANYQGAEEYTPDLVALVKAFQKENKLKPDGIVGRRSVAKLSDTPVATKINRVILAMERLRWHPRNFGRRYVFINQPAYRATYLAGGAEQFSMRIVVGKKSNQTNFFYDKIEKVVYNPYWGVPRSILVNEMLPKLRKNPSYLDQSGYELTTPSGTRISSASVNWNQVGSNFGYNVRQTPGPKNALGSLKILFPNKHAIYMHDTPAKGLFKRTTRAYSHGCVRLQQPQKMAAAVLGTNVSFVKSRIATGKNKTQFLKTKVPVYVAYFTAWPNAAGDVKYYYDVYDRDKYLMKALRKTSAARSSA